jgi:hypothetical protein
MCAKGAVPWLRPLTAEAWVRSRVGPCEIYGGQSVTGTGFFLSTSVFPCQFHSTGAPFYTYNKSEKILENLEYPCFVIVKLFLSFGNLYLLNYCWLLSGNTGCCKVSLPRIYSHSSATLLYLQATISRRWQWGAIEIFQLVVRRFQRTFHIS